jgi:peptidoglycan/LPS O-acetylase OafA/YrhL
MSSSHKILAAEGLRGVASQVVIFHHLSLAFFPYMHNYRGKQFTGAPIQDFIHNSPIGFFYSGTAAVFVFFVLSGYILTHTIFSKEEKMLQVVLMCLKRYFRLVIPVLTICVITFLLFSLIHVNENQDYSPWIASYGSGGHSLMEAIFSGSIDTFFLSGSSPFNPVLWTMKIELSGSFLIFLLCALKIKRNSPVVSVLTLVVLAYLIEVELLRKIFGLGLIAFIVGYWIYWYGKAIPLKVSFPVFIVGLYFAGAEYSSSSYQWIPESMGQYTYLAGNFLAGCIIVYTVVWGSHFNAMFSRKLCVSMGKVSFSTYLLHMPVLYALGLPFFDLLTKQNAPYVVASLLTSFLTLLGTYVISSYFYQYVDRNGIVLSNRLAQKFLKWFSIDKI